MSTICNMKGREADHVKVFPPGSYFENQDLKQQRNLSTSDCTVYDPSNNFNSAYTACTRAKKSMTVYWTEAKPSYFEGGQEIMVDNLPPSQFFVHDLCAFASDCYEPMQLHNICIVEPLSSPADSALFFNDAQSRIFPGRCLHDHPTEENYAPTLGCAIEFAVAHSLGVLAPCFSTKLAAIQNEIMIRYGCNCRFCPDAPCGLNKHKFKQLAECLVPTADFLHLDAEMHDFVSQGAENVAAAEPQVTWDHLLQLAVYESSFKVPQLCRQLVGTQSIDRNELTICRDRGVQMIHDIERSALMSESKLEAVNQILYQQPLSKSTCFGFVSGQADFLLGPTQVVVECKVTQEITTEHLTQAVLYSALTPFFGQPCYVMAPNLNQVVKVTPLPGISADYVLEHAVRRKLGL